MPGTCAATDGSACNECLAGRYASTSGAIACSKCAVGTFASDAGSDAGSVCPAGSYAPVPGARSCRVSAAALKAALECSKAPLTDSLRQPWWGERELS